jgi:hypothetical protein
MSNMYKYIKSLTMISINLVFPWYYKKNIKTLHSIPFSQKLQTKLHKNSQNEERGENVKLKN